MKEKYDFEKELIEYNQSFYDVIMALNVTQLEKLVSDMKEHNCYNIHELDLWAESSSPLDCLKWYAAWKSIN